MAETLADDQLGLVDPEIGMERGAVGGLDAVIRPEHLRPIGQGDRIERRLARMRAGKARMPDGMPVLGEDDMVELVDQPVHFPHDLVAAWNRQGAAWAEIVLQVNDQQTMLGHIRPLFRVRRISRTGGRTRQGH